MKKMTTIKEYIKKEIDSIRGLAKSINIGKELDVVSTLLIELDDKEITKELIERVLTIKGIKGKNVEQKA